MPLEPLLAFPYVNTRASYHLKATDRANVSEELFRPWIIEMKTPHRCVKLVYYIDSVPKMIEINFLTKLLNVNKTLPEPLESINFDTPVKCMSHPPKTYTNSHEFLISFYSSCGLRYNRASDLSGKTSTQLSRALKCRQVSPIFKHRTVGEYSRYLIEIVKCCYLELISSCYSQ